MPTEVTLIWGIVASVGMFAAVIVACRDASRVARRSDDASHDA